MFFRGVPVARSVYVVTIVGSILFGGLQVMVLEVLFSQGYTGPCNVTIE